MAAQNAKTGMVIVYLLDTNICIYIINKKPKNVTKKIESINISDIKLSSVTLAELEYGVSKSSNRKRNREALLHFVSPFDIIDFDAQDAEFYGIIRTELESLGKVIGPYDMQIAAQALNRDYTLVTNNTKEFQRIKELKLENWV
ncbi:twitching motility protein PilT [Endomicrobiia bacterium]|nr:twitching motility protein PilT [Endomicrobiia bacterium]